eukprot:gene13888-14005_t
MRRAPVARFFLAKKAPVPACPIRMFEARSPGNKGSCRAKGGARRTLTAGMLAGVALVAFAPGAAIAQSTAPAPAEAVAQPAAAPDIVVTAQRREQKLKDVGIAITVLDKETIKDLNITTATDVVRAIPNLRFNAFAASEVVFNMRGVAQNSYGDEQEPPVAVYQDDRAIQGRLAKDLDLRVSGLYDRDDGYIQNLVPGQHNRGQNNHWGLRGIFKWSPSSDFSAKLTLRYSESDHERQVAGYAFAPSCPNAQYQGVDLPANVVCPYWAPNASYNLPGYAGSSGAAANTVPGAMATGFDGIINGRTVAVTRGASPWQIAATGDPGISRQIFGATLRLEAKLGAFDVTSITDYQYINKFNNEIGDSQPEFAYVQGATYTAGPCPGVASITCYAPGTIFNQNNRTNQVSEELRAATTIGSANYLVLGAFAMSIESHFHAQYATPFDSYDPQVQFYQQTKSFAFFAQDEYKISDQFKFIFGARYWHDKKIGCYTGHEYWTGFNIHYCPDSINFSYDANPPFPGYADVTASTGGAIAAVPADARPSFSGLTVRTEVDYKPSANTLIYASYNRGSKSGGFSFSTGTPAALAVYDTINGIKFNPEVLNDYEIGLKTSLPGHSSLNVVAYYYDYHNYQAFVQVGYTQEIRNLQAKAKGIEAEFTSHPIPGLTLNLTGSWEESHVPDVLLPDGVTVVRHDLPQAPHWSGNALVRYEFPLAGGNASVQADSMYQSHMCFTLLCAPVEQEAAYHVENVRIGFTPKDTNVDLAFYVNNVFERAYRNYAYDGSLYSGATQSLFARPRSWGFNIRYHF